MNVKFIVRTLVNAAALWVATRVVSGVDFTGDWLPFLALAVVFGALNAFIAPVAKILSLPLIIVTLGLFLLVINALMLWLTSVVANVLGIGFHVRGFWPAFWGALVVSLVSALLAVLVVDRTRSHVLR